MWLRIKCTLYIEESALQSVAFKRRKRGRCKRILNSDAQQALPQLRSWDDKNGSQCTCNVKREKYWNGSFYHKFISFCYIGLIILLLLTSPVIYVNLIIFLHRCITRLHASGPCKDFRKFSIFGFQSNLDTINATLLITLPSIFISYLPAYWLLWRIPIEDRAIVRNQCW